MPTHKIQVTGMIKGEQGSRGTVGNREVVNQDKRARSNENIGRGDLSRGLKKTIAAGATMYAVGQTVVRPIIQNKVNIASMSGDYVQSRNIQKKNEMVDLAVSTTFEVATIALAFSYGPLVGGFAVAGTVSKHAQQSYNRYQNNKMLESENRINNFTNTYQTNRFVNKKGG